MISLPTERIHFIDNLRTFIVFLVIIYHAGGVYESSGIWASFWIVDDPVTNDLVGILNIIIDIFVMSAMFMIAGYFTRLSLIRKSPLEFARAKVKRLMLPWLIAVFTLVPLYKVIFLASRGWPQQDWSTYLIGNNGFSQNWLWFLPVLFVFDLLYLGLQKLNADPARIPLRALVPSIFILGVAYSFFMAIFGLQGWTLTPLLDFQHERVLVYLMMFLLGAALQANKALESLGEKRTLIITISAVSWIPIMLYMMILLIPFVKPGTILISAGMDELLKWIAFHLSLLMLLYSCFYIFKQFFNGPGWFGGLLNRCSYSVYIMHVIVLGGLAWLLLPLELSSLLKFLLLTLGTFVLSNLLAALYHQGFKPRLLKRG